jgi:UDP-glucose 4-epimerase
MKILIFGGAGYIGSHACIDLLSRGHDVAIFDNFTASTTHSIDSIELISGDSIRVIHSDMRDADAVDDALMSFGPQAVMNFAALKSIEGSFRSIYDYFENNIAGTINVLKAMKKAGTHYLVHSSSAAVYGSPQGCPIPESAPRQALHPYGRTKLVIEELIEDICTYDQAFKAVTLRYFNPIGAHPSGLLGDQSQSSCGLMPAICKVANGKAPCLTIYGADYKTRDGTGVRDYIHVVDLARAHGDAIDYLSAGGGSLSVNIGTGHGVSVLELVKAFERISGKVVPFRFAARRPGDIAECFASPVLAKLTLGWQAELGLERMCEDAWRWEMQKSKLSSGDLDFIADTIPQSATRMAPV